MYALTSGLFSPAVRRGSRDEGYHVVDSYQIGISTVIDGCLTGLVGIALAWTLGKERINALATRLPVSPLIGRVAIGLFYLYVPFSILGVIGVVVSRPLGLAIAQREIKRRDEKMLKDLLSSTITGACREAIDRFRTDFSFMKEAIRRKYNADFREEDMRAGKMQDLASFFNEHPYFDEPDAAFHPTCVEYLLTNMLMDPLKSLKCYETSYKELLSEASEARLFQAAKKKFQTDPGFTRYVLLRLSLQAADEGIRTEEKLFRIIVRQAKEREGDHLLSPFSDENFNYFVHPDTIFTDGTHIYLSQMVIQELERKEVDFMVRREDENKKPYFYLLLEEGILSPFVDSLRISLPFDAREDEGDYWISLATAWIGQEALCTFVIDRIKKRVLNFLTLKDSQGRTALDYFNQVVVPAKPDIPLPIVNKIRYALGAPAS